MRLHFNLSQNKSLRTLETTAKSITAAGDAAAGFLKTVLSTVTSPVLLDVVIAYSAFDVDCVTWYSVKPVRLEGVPARRRIESPLHHSARFRVFGEMYQTREFRLVLRVDVLECVAKHAEQMLGGIVAMERMDGGLDYLVCEPLIMSGKRSLQTRLTDGYVGSTGKWSITASAL